MSLEHRRTITYLNEIIKFFVDVSKKRHRTKKIYMCYFHFFRLENGENTPQIRCLVASVINGQISISSYMVKCLSRELLTVMSIYTITIDMLHYYCIFRCGWYE